MKYKKFTELQVGDCISLDPNICSVTLDNLVQKIIKSPENLEGETWVLWTQDFGRYYGKADTLISVHD